MRECTRIATLRIFWFTEDFPGNAPEILLFFSAYIDMYSAMFFQGKEMSCGYVCTGRVDASPMGGRFGKYLLEIGEIR